MQPQSNQSRREGNMWGENLLRPQESTRLHSCTCPWSRHVEWWHSLNLRSNELGSWRDLNCNLTSHRWSERRQSNINIILRSTVEITTYSHQLPRCKLSAAETPACRFSLGKTNLHGAQRFLIAHKLRSSLIKLPQSPRFFHRPERQLLPCFSVEHKKGLVWGRWWRKPTEGFGTVMREEEHQLGNVKPRPLEAL